MQRSHDFLADATRSLSLMVPTHTPPNFLIESERTKSEYNAYNCFAGVESSLESERATTW